MLSCVESILKDLQESTAHLLTDDVLEAATTAARRARASNAAREVSEAAQRLEDAVEDIRGKGPSSPAFTTSLNYEDRHSDQVEYVEAERRVVEKHLGGLMVASDKLY
ncbi:hypothetical protein V8D89_012089 [Ganoderma adspersum]